MKNLFYMMNINFYVKSMGSFIILSVMVIWKAYQMLPIAHWLIRVQGIGEDMPSNMLSFINFESLEFYWTYFFALQTTTPKILSMRLMSLDHEPKNKIMCYELEPWVLTPFLCKYGLFWALEEIPLKSMKVLTWCRSPMKWSHVVWKICPQHGETSKKSITPTHLHTRTVDTDMLFLSLKNYPNVFTKQFDMLFFKNEAFPKVFKK